MSLKKYVIRGLGEFFDGLVVHCGDAFTDGSSRIERIEQPSQLFETFSIPVNPGLFIDKSLCEPYVEPTNEQLTGNPFGKYKSEGKIDRDGVCITWGLYSRALTLNIKNLNKTLLSRNIFDGDAIESLKEYLDTQPLLEEWDIHEAIFDIQERCDG